MKNVVLLILTFGICPQANSQELYFPPVNGNWETVSMDSLGWCEEKVDSLQGFLGEKNTKAFMILKDGKIAVEWYYDGFIQDSLWYWASAGKTVMATLLGIAQSENLLSINDATSDYLGNGWTGMDLEKERQITIRNQLSMTTGLDYLLLNWNCTEPDCLKYRVEPNTQWFYHNAPYLLLKNVLEEATGENINLYFKQKIGDKIGMKGNYFPFPASGNLFFSTARDMAKFGLLTLAEGVWNGEEIMSDKTYFSQMVSTSQTINPSYGYLWWLNGKPSHILPVFPNSISGELIPSAPADMFCALGKGDQKIYVVPSQNLVVIRLGNEAEEETLALSEFDNELWKKINSLSSCEVIADLESEKVQDFRIYPNPARDKFYLASKAPIAEIKVFDLQGKLLLQTPQKTVDVSNLPRGIYVLEVQFKNGTKAKRRIWKR